MEPDTGCLAGIIKSRRSDETAAAAQALASWLPGRGVANSIGDGQVRPDAPAGPASSIRTGCQEVCGERRARPA